MTYEEKAIYVRRWLQNTTRHYNQQRLADRAGINYSALNHALNRHRLEKNLDKAIEAIGEIDCLSSAEELAK